MITVNQTLISNLPNDVSLYLISNYLKDNKDLDKLKRTSKVLYNFIEQNKLILYSTVGLRKHIAYKNITNIFGSIDKYNELEVIDRRVKHPRIPSKFIGGIYTASTGTPTWGKRTWCTRECMTIVQRYSDKYSIEIIRVSQIYLKEGSTSIDVRPDGSTCHCDYSLGDKLIVDANIKNIECKNETINSSTELITNLPNDISTKVLTMVNNDASYTALKITSKTLYRFIKFSLYSSALIFLKGDSSKKLLFLAGRHELDYFG